MKYRILYDSSQDYDFTVIAKEDSEVLRRIEGILTERQSEILGYSNGESVILEKHEIYAFITEGGRVYAITEKARYAVRERLYKLEEELSDVFVKINQSCLVNVKKIKSFGTSIGASLTVTLKNGYKDYVSRRQIKHVKERFGL